VGNFKSPDCKFIFIIALLSIGCLRTEGDLNITGKVTDEFTCEEIPCRNIIIQGIKKRNDSIFTTEAGQITTDSSGKFKFRLHKIKDTRAYNFVIVGDSDYALKANERTLFDLERNPDFISFSMNRLTDLTIIINRKAKIPASDTLSLAWDSNDVFFWSLYPYRIYNYDKTNNFKVASPGSELRWFGGYVNSIVRTKVFSEKKTKIYWDLNRNGKRIEYIDTITCKRDVINRIYFSY
jgi:hypothetical protein